MEPLELIVDMRIANAAQDSEAAVFNKYLQDIAFGTAPNRLNSGSTKELLTFYQDHEWLATRAIVTTHSAVEAINARAMERFPGEGCGSTRAQTVLQRTIQKL